jgi:lipopolysaccharide transport system permease protein
MTLGQATRGPRSPQHLREIARYRDLLYMLAWRDIRIKYKQSIMGFMWAILMPLLIVAAGMLVRYAFSRLSGQPLAWTDIATVSVKAVPWAFFVSSLRFSTLSLIANTSLVTKIYFPRELFPLAATLSQFFDFTVASVALAVILAVARIGISVQLLWVPLLVVLLVSLVLALGILFSALALFFRDVKYIVEVVLMFGIFFTPVFYDVELFGEWARILLLNPLAPILEGLAACIVRHEAPALGWLAYSAVFSLAALVLSYKVFKTLEPAFAENI